jgi:arylsulfatase A-like enzyme
MKFIFHFILTACVLSGSIAKSSEDLSRPNFLIIVIDDLSPEQFSCYSEGAQKSPNIDALAKSGVQFKTAWATPMCSSSRALLTTGRYAHRTGIWHNDLRINAKPSERYNWTTRHITFASLLRDNGYQTVMVGNNMALGGRVDTTVGFNEYCHRADQQSAIPAGETFTGLYEGKYNFPGAKPIPSRYWHPCIITNGKLMETSADDFGPDIFVDYLIEFMGRNKNRPFLAYYPMNLVHDIAGGGIPTMPFRGRPGTNKGGSLEDLYRYIDQTVGRLISALDANGLRENTIVIFTSDNGDSKHGMKMHATENGPRVPFIVNAPSIVKPLGITDEMMEFADVFPTLMDFSQSSLPVGYEIDGKSLRPFLTGRSDTHRESIMSYIATARMARTRDYLLEAVDPVYGDYKGRIYRTNGSHLRQDYEDISHLNTPDVVAARKIFERILEANPWPDRSDPAIEAEVKSYDSMPYKHYLDTGKLIQKIY